MTRRPSSAPSKPKPRRGLSREEQEQIQRETREKRWAALSERLGEQYANCTVKNFRIWGTPEDQANQRAAVAKVTDYLKNCEDNVNRGKNVIFYGPKGTGKDHLLVAMMRFAVAGGARVRWWDGLNLYAHLRGLVGSKKNDKELLDTLIDAHVVAISDPVPPRGGKISDHAVDFLFRLVDARARKRRAIWVTANYADQQDAEDRTAPQIHDRIRDGAMQVPCEWQSYRSPET